MRQSLRDILRGGLVAWMVCSAGISVAGELKTQDSTFCDWTLTGEIAPGDLRQISQAPIRPGATTLCLDSQGGDITEALTILSHLRDRQIRTRVLPGQKCQGACAMAFLGGAMVDGAGAIRFPHREVWPGARLSFATPQVDALAMAERLYTLKTTTELGDRLIADHLYLQLLRHQTPQTYPIDTVGDAYLTNIPVMGVRAPDRIEPRHIRHICDAVYLRHRLHDGIQGRLTSDFLSTAHSSANLARNRLAPLRAVVTDARPEGPVQGYAGPYWAGSKYWRRECYVTIQPQDVAAYGGDNAALGITGIAVEFRDYGGADRNLETFDSDSWIAATRLVGAYDVPPLLMYPFHARLDNLPLNEQALAARAAGGPVLPPPSQGMARFDGMDLSGGDIGRVTVTTGKECMTACADTTACTAATFDRWNGLCILKNFADSSGQLSRQPKSDVYVAGSGIDALRDAPTPPVILRRSGKGFFDRPAFYLKGADFDDCAAQCLNSPSCNAFNFLAETGACQVFDRPGEYFDRAGIEAGLKMQPL